MVDTVELPALLDRLATLVDEVGEPQFAHLYREHAARIRSGIDRSEYRAICADVVDTLRVAPGSLADRYLVHDDGRPDVERSREYVDLIDLVRKRAKRGR